MSSSALQQSEPPSSPGSEGAREGVASPPPARPVASAAPRASSSSWGEWMAAGLKLASALCALAAAGLFVRPLLLGELSLRQRMVTLQPSFSSKPVESPPGTATPQESPPNAVIRESRAEFDGAILMVESEPSGATVLVGGKDQGTTPVSVGLECVPGSPVLVELSLRDYEKASHRTLCPLNALVKVTAQLRKSPGKSSGK